MKSSVECVENIFRSLPSFIRNTDNSSPLNNQRNLISSGEFKSVILNSSETETDVLSFRLPKIRPSNFIEVTNDSIEPLF